MEINFKKIEEFRKNNKMSIACFCLKCGICVKTYYKIKNKKDVSFISLFKIARTIKIKIHELFE